MKFLHIADVHLGIAPDAGKSWSLRRQQDIWDSFREVLAVAEREKVDLVLIAGDLFHRQPLMRELKQVNELFGGLTRTKVALIAGNHDYMHPRSNYRGFSFAENVIFFDREQIKEVELPEYQACIYGLSYWHKEITDGLYDALRPKDPAKINILLAHGGDAKHIPMSEAALRQNGFDYVACGHIHKGGQIIKNKAVMAGSLEPTDCNDFGPHGYWMGEVTKRGCEVSFYPIRKCEYVRHEIRVDVGMTAQDVEECLKRDLAKKEPYEKYHVILTGGYTPGAEPDTARLLELPDVAAVENCLVPAYDFAQLKREYRGTLLERYISKIEALPQNAVTKEALYYGVDAICQAMEHR